MSKKISVSRKVKVFTCTLRGQKADQQQKTCNCKSQNSHLFDHFHEIATKIDLKSAVCCPIKQLSPCEIASPTLQLTTACIRVNATPVSYREQSETMVPHGAT